MGVDLVGVKGGAFHLNWYGWRLMKNILTAAGADTDEMPFANDGKLVEEETCIEWAEKLEKFLADSRTYIINGKSEVVGRSIDEAIAIEMMSRLSAGKIIIKKITEKREIDTIFGEFIDFLRRCGGFRCY